MIDQYLSAYHFNEFHSIEINGHVDGLFTKLLQTDFSNSTLIKFLFRLRGMPKELYTIEHLTRIGFIKLNEEPGREVVYGIITNSPSFNTCLPIISPAEFIALSGPAIIKAVINFKVKENAGPRQTISTETRVWCGSRKLKKKFSYYWFIVKPFSQLIRKAMLKEMKKQITPA